MFTRIVLLCLSTFVMLPGAQAADETTREMFQVTQRFAEAGSREGQFKLAEMYEQGHGTPVDLDKALVWYQKAAEGGHEEARRRVEDWNARQQARAETRRREELARQQAEQRAREQALAAERAAEQERARQEAERLAQEVREREAARRNAEQARREALARREAEKRAAAERARREKEAHALEAAQRRAADQNAAPQQAAVQAPPAETSPKPNADAGSESFEVDPCKTSAARFMSTCR